MVDESMTSMSGPLPHTGDFVSGKEKLYRTLKRGRAFDRCASLSPRYVCCNVHVLRAVSNCPFHCSYCFLQDYLTNQAAWVVTNTDALLEEVREAMDREPRRFFRIGTWELGDSLAHGSGGVETAELIRGFAGFKNAVLELKTKSDLVDPLLSVEHRGRTVVAWSLNTARIIEEEERGTARLDERLEALRKVVRAGFWVSLHFDPVIWYEGCAPEYESLVAKVFESVSSDRVVWVSLGALRFNPEMKRTLEINYPGSRITAAEMVGGDDHKVRYPRPVRVALFRRIYRAIREHAGDDLWVYLCMERANVWREVLGLTPRSAGHVDYLIARSLYERFPGLVEHSPELSLYDPRE